MQAHDLFLEMQDVGPDAKLLSEAEEYVDQEHKKRHATERVQHLVEVRDRMVLEQAIREAEEAGVPSKELRNAKLELREMIEEEKATTALHDAVHEHSKKRDVAGLRKAIATAEQAGVPELALQHAHHALEEMTREL